MKRLSVLCFVILFLCATANAITVERITLAPHQSSVFVGNVRTAFNSVTGSTLVVWDRQAGSSPKHSLWARLINAAGAPSGSAFKIVKGPNAVFADLTFNADQNEFLLVYSNETNGAGVYEVFAQKLKANGKRSGKPVRISLSSDHGENIMNFAPFTIYDPGAQGYVVIWRRYGLAANVGIQDGLYGIVLNSDLTVRATPVLMAPLQGDFSNVRGPFITDIGFHPTNGKLLLTGWSQSTEPGFSVQYFLAKADPTLKKPVTKLTKLKKNLSSGAAPFAELVFLPDNQVEALFVEGTGVRKRKVNTRGVPSGPDSLFFTGAVQTVPLEFPVSALATDDDREETAVVGIEDSSTNTGKIWFQTANRSGVAVGQPFELQSNLDIGARPAISALPNPPSSGFLYAVIYIEGVRSFPAVPNESSALILLKVTTP